MWEILQILGIEAAVQFLHLEFAKIISVSKRHLDVLIDWMTSTGSIASVSRYGVDIAKVGPMAKASFEQPLEAFFEAAHTAQREIITGVSAAVATGVLANAGTGGFKVMLNSKKLENLNPLVDEKTQEVKVRPILEKNVIEHFDEGKETEYSDTEEYVPDDLILDDIDYDEIEAYE